MKPSGKLNWVNMQTENIVRGEKMVEKIRYESGTVKFNLLWVDFDSLRAKQKFSKVSSSVY